jgi:uncharacterized protein
VRRVGTAQGGWLVENDDGNVPLPALGHENRAFWTGGAEGRLLIARCGDCRRWLHPPIPVCDQCGSRNIAPEAASGRAMVLTYTINRHAWTPGTKVPYLIAIVELVEQPKLRLTTRIVGCPVHGVRIGMAVEVVFQRHEDVWLPYFQPVAA